MSFSLDDLPEDQQEYVREIVDRAKPLSQRQRSELERLFSAVEDEGGAA